MTDPKMKDMTAKEALEIFEGYIDEHAAEYCSDPSFDDSSSRHALATLTALAEDYEKVKAERDVFQHNLEMEIRRAASYAAEFRKVEAALACKPTPQADPKAGDVGQEGEK